MPSKINISNHRFGYWKVLKQGKTFNNAIYWLCRCDCGTKMEVRGRTLRRGESKSCGCRRNEMISKFKLADLEGRKFGSLVVVKRAANNIKTNKPNWLCKCDCGKKTIVASNALLNNATKSCGCKQYKKGKDSIFWKGGRQKNKDGYILVHGPDNDMANSHGYVFEHRLVMSRKIGRSLFKNETVHHINGNRSDNRIKNLELWVKPHPYGQRVADIVKFSVRFLKIYAPQKIAA